MRQADRPALLGGDGVEAAVRALAKGAVVGVPTDTVYGLAACLERPAIDRVFAAKGRPSDLALPVLIGGLDQLGQVATSFPAVAAALATRFWPGPLTLVVRARRAVGSLVGGDGRTVGVRWPNHPLIEELCLLAGPLATTSANRHGQPPAATAAEIVENFGASEVTLVLDGGPCEGSVSTVVDCAGRRPRCLREGALSWELVQSVVSA